MTTSGGLYDPLGTDRRDQSRRMRPSPPVVVAATVLGAIALVLAVASLRNGGDRGEPSAVVTIEHPPPMPATPATATVAPDSARPPVRPVPPPTAAASTDGREADVEIQNGVKVIRMRSEAVRLPIPATVVPPAAGPPTSGSGTK